MSERPKQKRWRPNARDAIFLAIVVGVVLALSLGSHERRTKPTPDDPAHIHAMSRDQCMSCHGTGGARPQPKGHTREDQCFQCHKQPRDWAGNKQ